MFIYSTEAIEIGSEEAGLLSEKANYEKSSKEQNEHVHFSLEKLKKQTLEF